MSRSLLFPVWLLAAALTALSAQDWEDAQLATGDAAAAERYVQWAQAAIDDGRWGAAEEALERAADYAEVSSDLSYLLAFVRNHERRPRRAVLEALYSAFAFNRWNSYSAAEARLLEAETFVAIRSFEEALDVLQLAGDSSREISLRALAYQGLNDSRGFIQTIKEALDRYPRSAMPVRILFKYAANRIPGAGERELISICLRRLPLLLDEDPELAFLAVPFIRDTEEARRLVSTYRASGGTDLGALPPALNLGIVDETQALVELFHNSLLDKDLLETVWGLLRSGEDRRDFARNLSAFSGFITEDIDRDGYIECRTAYRNGSLLSYSYDADQDLLPELDVFFNIGLPARAELAADDSGKDRSRVFLEWEQYPAVLSAELGEVKYIPRPGEFLFKPLQFRDFLGSALLYPEREFIPRISRRTLVSFALTIEQPGTEIPGSIERIEMQAGIPRLSREYLRDRLVSETEYLLGQPKIQRIDMDLDGRLETIRRYNRDLEAWASSESDWDGDGVYEYGETYAGDLVIRSWDMDKDGIREYSETGVRN
ncbi:hypothetical protein [Treponema primitia]|uniref:hypothetical protein n=1 Tax=Treponema primitia TaxID=88058 RepID=UPI0002554D4A|nr:hypothetical protein [Treponema primitia]